MKKLSLSLTLAAVLLTCVLSVSYAETVTPSPTPIVTNKLLQQTVNQETRLATVKTRADSYITMRLNAINVFLGYIKNSKVSSSAQAQAVTVSLNTDSSGLTALKSQIDAFTNSGTIKTGLLPLVQQIFSIYRVYAIEVPKDHMLLHVAFAGNLNTNYTAAEQNFTQDIAYAQTQSKDVSTLEADNTKYTNDVAKFNTDLQSAQTALAAITPSDYQKGISAFMSVKSNFSAVHTDSQTIHADFLQFTKDFKALFGL